MLSDTEAIATVAVRDLKKAAAFYEGTLGLKVKASEGDEVISYATGSTASTSTAPSSRERTRRPPCAGRSATASTRSLGRSRPRASPSSTTTCRVSSSKATSTSAGGMRVAWFKDPDGNILNIVSG